MCPYLIYFVSKNLDLGLFLLQRDAFINGDYESGNFFKDLQKNGRIGSNAKMDPLKVIYLKYVVTALLTFGFCFMTKSYRELL